MRRNPSPSDHSRQSQRVQPAGIVIRYPLRENRPLPLDRRSLKALQPANRLEQSLLAGKLPLRGQMLPVEQKPHIDRRRYRLNLLPQRVQRALVNPLQQTPLAPLHILIRNTCPPSVRLSKQPAQNRPRHLQPQHLLPYLVRPRRPAARPERATSPDPAAPSIPAPPCAEHRLRSHAPRQLPEPPEPSLLRPQQPQILHTLSRGEVISSSNRVPAPRVPAAPAAHTIRPTASYEDQPPSPPEQLTSEHSRS